MQVENTLFRVPKDRLASNSDIFRTMFTLPSGDDCQQEGHDDHNPLILQGIKADEFHQFLRLLYPKYVL